MFSLFKKPSQELAFNSFAEYYIGADVKANGSFNTDQDIYIDGIFGGTIKTTGLIELAKNSTVKADISARTAIIEGHYIGDAKISDELRITSCATVKGNVESQNIIVDKGAILQAKIKMERG